MVKPILVVGSIGISESALVRVLCKQGPFIAGMEKHNERPFQHVFKTDSRHALRQSLKFP